MSYLKRRRMSTGLASNAPLMDLDQQNVWKKSFWKKDTLIKDAGNWLASFLEISFSHRCFWHNLQLQICLIVISILRRRVVKDL